MYKYPLPGHLTSKEPIRAISLDCLRLSAAFGHEVVCAKVPAGICNAEYVLTVFRFSYVFPLTMRSRFSQIFQDPSCVQWWLPNDEGLTPIVRSVRAFADERNANPVSEQTENLREMSAIFAKMGLGQRDGSLSPPEPSPPRKGKNVMS